MQTIGERQVVYLTVNDEAGRFIQRTVWLGALIGDGREVLSGLKPGDIIVTEGGFSIGRGHSKTPGGPESGCQQASFTVLPQVAHATVHTFVNSGGLVWANIGLLALLLAVKQVTKILGVYPFAIRYVPKHAMFMTLLMSTGLTFGTISSLYGLNAGILSRAQCSVLVTVVVASAVVPTLIAQRWFAPKTRPGHRVAVEH